MAPLAGWPKWAGTQNHQISGLAFRDGRLYAIPDQSGAETRALLEIGLDDTGSKRELPVRVLCRWKGGPNPDAEGLAIDPPFAGRPRAFLVPLENEADVLIEIGAGDCEYLGSNGPLLGTLDNEGVEGVALAPDGKTLFLVQETQRKLLTLPRGGQGPARLIAKIGEAGSLCDIAYDNRGTAADDDDRLLLLDRNDRQIFQATLEGKITGRYVLDKDALGKDPDGIAYSLVSLESLAIETREADGSLLVYAATDTPPHPFPYYRKDGKDPEARYDRRIGMLYRFRLPPLPEEPGAPPPKQSAMSGRDTAAPGSDH